MPIRKLVKHIGNHHNSLLSFSQKHTKAGIPDPCIRVKKGTGRVFVENFFDPSTAFDVAVRPHLEKAKILKKKEPKVHKLKRAKKHTVCLW